MSLLWMDGFEGASSNAEMTTYIARRYPRTGATVGSSDYQRAAGCGSTSAVYLTSVYGYIYAPLLTTERTLIVGFAFKMPTGSGTRTILALGSSLGQDGLGSYPEFLTIDFYVSGATKELKVYRHDGATGFVLAGTTATDNAFQQNRWHFIELKVYCEDAVYSTFLWTAPSSGRQLRITSDLAGLEWDGWTFTLVNNVTESYVENEGAKTATINLNLAAPRSVAYLRDFINNNSTRFTSAVVASGNLAVGDAGVMGTTAGASATYGTIELRYGGRTLLSLKHDTKPYAYQNYYDYFRLYTGTYYDNLYVCNTAGSHCNDFLGPIKITTAYPVAAGDAAEWTGSGGGSHYTYVDDFPSPNDDTDYVESETIGQKELWNYLDVSDLGDTIYAAQAVTLVRSTDAECLQLKTLAKSGGGSETENTAEPVGVDYTELTRLMEFQPGTSDPWTVSVLNAYQFGVKVG